MWISAKALLPSDAIIKLMRIILAVADYNGKNVVFVTEQFQVVTLDQARKLVASGLFEDMSVVRNKNGFYLRTKKNIPKERELGHLSLTVHELTAFAQGAVHAKSTRAISRYLELYQDSLVGEHEFIKPLRTLFKVPVVPVRDMLVANQKYIFSAAEHFRVDPFLLGAILIDEVAGILPFEAIFENIGAKAIGLNTSVGVAQVKIDTANHLIRKGLYNPNPKDKKLPFRRMNPASRLYLAPYIIEPKHNIFFAAALIRSFVDEWYKFVDLSKMPEIIATLYHLDHRPPHADPHHNARGEQIAVEFYSLAKKWLKR